ncbi:MAG TPA: hypothetical protein VIT38_07480 [Allosphingosinicella sp.]|jgi:hypothetical protein
MKTFLMTMTALSALSLAAPAAAQSWYGDRSNGRELQMRFDAGVRSGAISRREATPLRVQLNQLTTLERQYSRGGFSGRERSALRERSRTISMNIMAASRDGRGRDGRYSQNDGPDGKPGYGENDRAGPAHRGDRFTGDLRVGQHVSSRQVALPMEYRARYRDSDESYYRYDADRVYQVDRATGVIMAMFDIGG